MSQIIGVSVVTCGIVVTFADASKFAGTKTCCENEPGEPTGSTDDAPSGEADLSTWLVGISMLTAALFMSAILGHLQELSYRTYGKDGVSKSSLAGESKLYSHLLALPLFLTQVSDIQNHVEIFSASEPLRGLIARSTDRIPTSLLTSPLGDVPILYVYLFLNVFTQYICISGVYKLTAVSSTLTCTLTLTVRKSAEPVCL